jgi:adenylate cyclase class IV
LAALGYEPLVTVDKTRVKALVEDVLVALDTVKDLGDFVELEATVPHGDFEQTKSTSWTSPTSLV